jgi:hypothetical protein
MAKFNSNGSSTLGLAPGPDYNQESAKKWVLLRSISGKDFPCPANVLGQFLWRAELLRDDSFSHTSIDKIDKVNIDAVEGLHENISEALKVAKRQQTC